MYRALVHESDEDPLDEEAGQAMATDNRDRQQGRFKRWFHETFDDLWFRSLIGPAETTNAIQGSDQAARDQWKRDLEHRKQYTREQHELRRREHEAERGEASDR